MDKISIITPSLNQGEYLEQTIDSVLSQNYPDLEYIIIDGGSTDQSGEIIKKYKKHLAHWVSEKDRGQSDAINKGLQRATGNIVNWLNADDYYEPGTLQTVANQFNDDTVNVVCGRGKVIRDGQVVKISRGTDVYPNNLIKTIGWARIDQPETFFRRRVLEKTGLLNFKLHYVMDKAWWINYLLAFGLGGVRKLKDILVNFRLHEASKTVSQSEGFVRETDALFLTLARQYDLLLETEGLSLLSDINHIEDGEWQFVSDGNSHLVRQVLHYYMLHRVDEFYYQHQQKKAKIGLSYVDPKLLHTEEQALYQKLQWRCRWIPVPLVKLMRT